MSAADRFHGITADMLQKLVENEFILDLSSYFSGFLSGHQEQGGGSKVSDHWRTGADSSILGNDITGAKLFLNFCHIKSWVHS